LERVAASNAEEVAQAVEMLKKVKLAIEERAEETQPKSAEGDISSIISAGLEEMAGEMVTE
jgi:hypothetical protein